MPVVQKLCRRVPSRTLLRIKPFAAAREASGNVHPDNEMPNKTTMYSNNISNTDIVCLRQVLIDGQSIRNYDRTDLKQYMNCSNWIRLQLFSIVTGSVILCVKSFMCCGLRCVQNGTLCVTIGPTSAAEEMSQPSSRNWVTAARKCCYQNLGLYTETRYIM
jgi:hypothetical protein